MLAGYGAALSMALYLAVKIIWIVAGLLGPAPDGYGTADWVMLNVVTVVMAATGIALGLALAQPWGRRLAAVPVIFFSWVGAGFLVPMLPYVVISSVLGGDGSDGSGSAARGEEIFIAIGFAGMAVGLAVALPIYLRERWPRPFLGRVGDGRTHASAPVTVAMAVAIGLGLLWSSWALGGTLGLDPAHRDQLELNDRLLSGSSGLWALVGAWSVWTLTHRRPAGLRQWVPMTLALGASGSMFAWSGWKLPVVILRPGGFVTGEYTVVAIAEHILGISVGLVLLAAILKAARGHDARDGRRPPADAVSRSRVNRPGFDGDLSG